MYHIFYNTSSVSIFVPLSFSPTGRLEPPRWACALCALGLFFYQSLDAIDGKQARRTNSSSPLGELFDHGCDSISTIFVALSACISAQLGFYPKWMFFQVILAMAAAISGQSVLTAILSLLPTVFQCDEPLLLRSLAVVRLRNAEIGQNRCDRGSVHDYTDSSDIGCVWTNNMDDQGKTFHWQFEIKRNPYPKRNVMRSIFGIIKNK